MAQYKYEVRYVSDNGLVINCTVYSSMALSNMISLISKAGRLISVLAYVKDDFDSDWRLAV